MLQTDRGFLASLYEGAPKVMLLDMAAEAGSLIDKAESFRWLIARGGGHGGLVVGDADRSVPAPIDRCPLEIPPANVLAVWAPGTQDNGLAHDLMSWWRDSAGNAALPPLVLGGRAALDRVLLARALEQTRVLSRDNERLMRDLAALREVWENEARIPPEIEELMQALRLSPPRLVFASPVSTQDRAVPSAGTASLRQRLPTQARGFLGVDLQITHPGLGEGLLQAEVISLDAGAPLARWQVPFGMLCAGWLPLRLERASSRPWRSLELNLTAVGGAGSAPRLAMGPVGLLREYACAPPASHGQDAAARTMLSLRLWGGLPGMPHGEMEGSNGLPADPIVPVPDPAVAAVRLTRELKANFPCFGYLERGRILLRPLRTLASAAALTLPSTPGLIAVSCDAVIDDKQCQTRRIGARLVVMPPGHSAEEAERAELALAASDWVELDDPLQPRKLVARFATPHNMPVDLHLFSRLPTGGSINHARVVFERFEAEIHAGTAWKMAPVFPS